MLRLGSFPVSNLPNRNEAVPPRSLRLPFKPEPGMFAFFFLVPETTALVVFSGAGAVGLGGGKGLGAFGGHIINSPKVCLLTLFPFDVFVVQLNNLQHNADQP